MVGARVAPPRLAAANHQHRRLMTGHHPTHPRAGWLIAAQAIGAIGSLVALVITLSRPVRYVADLAGAVDRLAEVASRLDSSTRAQEGRLATVEQGVARMSASIDEARRLADIQEARLRAIESRR
jgi:hypothetical protein